MKCPACGSPLPSQTVAQCGRCLMIAELVEELVRKQIREGVLEEARSPG